MSAAAEQVGLIATTTEQSTTNGEASTLVPIPRNHKETDSSDVSRLFILLHLGVMSSILGQPYGRGETD